MSTATGKNDNKRPHTLSALFTKNLTGRVNVSPPCRIGLKHGDLYKQSLKPLKITMA